IWKLCSSCDHADPTSLQRAGLSPNHDLDILVERRQQVHQAFNGEPCQLVVTKCRDLRLRNSQHLGSITLRQLTRLEHLVQCVRQPQFRLAFSGIWISEILENVRGPASDPGRFSASFCHSAPRNLAALVSVFARPDRRPAWPSGCRTATFSGTREARTPPARIEPCTPLDRRFRRATRRSPAHRTETFPRLRRWRRSAELRDAESVPHVVLHRRGKAQKVALGRPDPVQRLLVGGRDTTHFTIISVLGYSGKRSCLHGHSGISCASS